MTFRTTATCVLLLALAACEADPLGRSGTARATDANATNLRVMLADRGSSASGNRG